VRKDKVELASVFNFLSFILALMAIIKLLDNKVTLTNCLVSISFFIACDILSKFGKLDKASIDFDDKKIELDGADEPSETAKDSVAAKESDK